MLDDAPYLGLLDTRSDDALVTDSAAAATEWAIGRPGKNEVIGAPPDAPQPNLFERLAKAGRAAGFVTTTRVTHATPAPFYARVHDRDDEQAIAAQLVDAMPTVAIGGGRREFLPKTAGGIRTDGRDLLHEARERKIAVLDSLVTPLPKDEKVLLLLADSHLPHDVGWPRPDPQISSSRRSAGSRHGAPVGSPRRGRPDRRRGTATTDRRWRATLRLDRAVAAALRVDIEANLVWDRGPRRRRSNLHENAHPEADVVTATVEDMAARIFAGKPWKGTPAALQAKALPILVDGARHTGLTSTDVDRLLTAPNDGDRTAVLGSAISRRFGIVFMPIEDRFTSTRVSGHTSRFRYRPGAFAPPVHGIRDHAALGSGSLTMRLPVTPPAGCRRSGSNNSSD